MIMGKQMNASPFSEPGTQIVGDLFSAMEYVTTRRGKPSVYFVGEPLERCPSCRLLFIPGSDSCDCLKAKS